MVFLWTAWTSSDKYSLRSTFLEIKRNNNRTSDHGCEVRESPIQMNHRDVDCYFRVLVLERFAVPQKFQLEFTFSNSDNLSQKHPLEACLGAKGACRVSAHHPDLNGNCEFRLFTQEM